MTVGIRASIEVAVRCDSKWQSVSFKSGLKHCNNEYSKVFHLQPEHYEEKLGDLIEEVSQEAQDRGWVDGGKYVKKKGGEDRACIPRHWEETYIPFLYCTSCCESIIDDDNPNGI